MLWTSPFTIQSLGTLGGRWSQSTGVNSFRNVVGTSETASGNYEAFFREAASGTMRSIGLFGGSWSEAAEINEDNVVAGTADDGQGGILGFLWHPHGGILGKWPLAYIKAVNNRQTAAGYTWSFAFQAAFATTFPLSRPPVVSGGPSSTYQDINDQDLAVGACQSGWWYACASAAGAAPTLLPPLNTSGSINDIAEGVNNYGTIVGTSAGKAVMWHP